MNKSKKIGLLITIFDLHFGGISNLILQTTPALLKEISVDVVYFGPKEEMLQRYRDAGIRTTRIPYNGSKDLLRAGKGLGRFIKQQQIDVVSTHLFMDKVITTIARRHAKFKILSTFHSVNNPYSSKNLKFLLNSRFEDFFHNYIADKNLAVSKASLDSWKKYRNLKHKNSRVLYSGIEKLPCEVIVSGEFGKKNKIFVTACRFTAEKGLERLIKLFSNLNPYYKNWEFWIIGDGFLKPELKKLVQGLGLEKKVLFKGFQTELCQFYKDADFYINGSYHEALPVSIIESISIGMPVIASEVGGIPEIVINEVNGYLVNFNNEEGSCIALKKCLDISEGEYKVLSKNSKDIFNEKFSIRTYVENFVMELKTLLENDR